MALVRILKDYKPSEGWRPGQIVDITNPWALIREGKVALVDEDGKEIENPDILMQIQNSLTSTEALDLVSQLINNHPNRDKILGALKDAKADEEVVEENTRGAADPESSAPITLEEEDDIMARVKAVKRKEAVREAAKKK